MNRILIVEDEIEVIIPLETGLQAHGFQSSVARNGREAIAVARDPDFDLVLLDIGLPKLDGWSVLSELRQRGEQMPIIMLTARDNIRDKIAGLEGGADDYVTKPFSFQELLARIRLRLRKNYLTQTKEAQVLTAGNISLNLYTRQVSIDDHIVELATREFTLLETLMKQPDQVISRTQLLKEVWGYDYDPGTNIVDVYVGYLRKKLGTHLIKTVRGVGYRIQTPKKSRQV